jgi:autotransporter-associated beta strand protein
MRRIWYRKWFEQMSRCASRRRVAKIRWSFTRPLRLERLEDRLTPSTHTWTGNNSALWSDPGNWVGGSPVGDPSPDLVFPANPHNLNPFDNIPGQIYINSITLTGSNYLIAHVLNSSIRLGYGITDNATGDNQVGLGIGLIQGVAFTHYFTVATGGSLDVPGFLSDAQGNNSITKDGGGEMVLVGSGAVTYSGYTAINAGTLGLRNNTLPSTTVVNVAAGAKLALIQATPPTITIDVLNGPAGSIVDLGAGTLHLQGGSFSGVIRGSANSNLFMDGTGNFTLSGPNTYSGATHLTRGTLVVGANNAVPAGTAVTVSAGASFNLNGHIDTIGSLAGAGNVIQGTLTTGADNTSTTFSGVITGAGPLFKVGTGTMTLSGNNNNFYTADINGGTLLVNGFQPHLGINVGSSGTLGGTGTISGADVGNSPAGGTLSPGTGTTTGVLHSNGSVFFNSPSTFRVRLNGSFPGAGGYDQLSASGPVNITNQPTLNASLGFSPQINETFTIILCANLTGHFNGLPENTPLTIGGARFRIHYTANSAYLQCVPGPATQYRVTAAATSTAGAPFDVTVTALDSNGNIVDSYAGTVHFTSQDPFGASLPADYTFTVADAGTHTFSGGATLFTAGNWDVTAADTSSGITGSAIIQVAPASAVQFILTAPAQTTSGTAFDLTVTAVDPFGNTDTNYQGTVTFSSSDTDPAVILPADYPFQAGDMGSVAFSGGATLITPGDQSITATDTVSGITGSATITVAAGPFERALANPRLPAARPAPLVDADSLPIEQSAAPPPNFLAADHLLTTTEMTDPPLAIPHARHDASEWTDHGLWGEGQSDGI